MNKKKFIETLQALINTPAMVEAIIGKKAIRKIFKRLSKLSTETEMNVWLVLHNMIEPINAVKVKISDKNEKSLVIEEACRIYSLMKSTPCKDVDALVEDAVKLAKKRENKYAREIIKQIQNGKWKDLRQIHPEGYCQRD